MNTLISINTNKGSIQIDLFGEYTPLTVNNFLNYVNSGAYSNTIIHREATLSNGQPFIIQGGGYLTSQFTANPLPATPAHITQNAAVLNEPKISNLRGTIAMAKRGSATPEFPDPVNSATTEWFINLNNDNAITSPLSNGQPGPKLDEQNGGFTAFGEVVGGGMSVADAIYNLNSVSVPFSAGAFSSVPYDGTNFVTVNSITVLGTHAAYQNPYSTVDINNDGILENLDAQIIINDLVTNGIHASNTFTGNQYLYRDSSGNNTIDPLDAQRVINAIILHGTGGAAPPDEESFPGPTHFAAPAMSAVPEPSALVLAGMAATGLAYGVWKRRRSRR
ncbi:MAG: peptidylprolyl isomerase [Pirellulales bacterium]